MANSATNSGSYNAQLRKVVGIEDYHAGKTDKISGLEVKDLKTMVIHFTDMEPEMKFPNAGFIVSSLLPYHYLKDVPFDKLASSDKVQKDPLFYGPFKIKNMVRGQSVSWVPNEYYGVNGLMFLRSTLKWSLVVKQQQRCELINMIFY